VAREGQDRCACGCKYWEHDKCIDCGTGLMVRLPFWPDGDREFYDYEVESVGNAASDGSREVVLIKHRDGRREKDNRGHFRRSRRSLDEVTRALP